MSEVNTHVMVGNEFVIMRARLKLAASIVSPESAAAPQVSPTVMTIQPEIAETVNLNPKIQLKAWLDALHRHSFIVFALMFLLVGVSSIKVGGMYFAAHTDKPVTTFLSINKHTITGLNLGVTNSQLEQTINKITAQPVSLTVGDHVVAVSPTTIRSWLQVNANSKNGDTYISVKTDTMGKSLIGVASQFVKAPVDQVTVTHDGSSQVVVAGRDGAQLTDTSTLMTQAHDVAKTVMDGKGLQFNTPLSAQPFQSVTPAAFTKLIEVNVNTKQMYLYDNGNLTRSYPISAGAPVTPTPIGEFHVYGKVATEDMTGFNANGTKYLQPHVHWINYFLPGGYAIHGNYWRPLSWFGVINSSHGCVSLPDDEAVWVYDWTPVGTTIITHY